MEPSQPQPPTTPEQPSPNPGEQLQPATEQTGSAVPSPPAPAQPAPAQPTQPAAQTAAPQPVPAKLSGPSQAPTTADDVDVIEKEWVDAAEKVAEENAEDPHNEEEGFEDLQVNYLKKRYGKDIKKPQE